MTLEEARELLGLPPKASRKEIRSAYRREARRWHPDRAAASEEAAYRDRMQQGAERRARCRDIFDALDAALDRALDLIPFLS